MKSGDPCECGGRFMVRSTRLTKSKRYAWRYVHCKSCGKNDKFLGDPPLPRAPRQSLYQTSTKDEKPSGLDISKKKKRGRIKIKDTLTRKEQTKMNHLNLEAVCARYNCEPLTWLKWATQGIVPQPDGAGLWSSEALAVWEADEGIEAITAAKTDRAMNDVLNAGSKWTTSPTIYKN